MGWVMTHKLLRYRAGMAAGLLCLGWWAGLRVVEPQQAAVQATQGQRPPLPATTTPVGQKRAEAPAEITPRVASSRQLPVQRHQLLKGAVLLERRVLAEDATTGVQHVVELHRTGFKYPLIRVEQWLLPALGGAAAVVQRELLSVADHAMVRFPIQMTEDDIAEWAERQGLVVRKRLRMQRLHLIAKERSSLSAADTVMQAFYQDFPQQQAVVQPVAERDYLYFTTTVPNDAHFIHLWGLNNTGQTAGTADADIDAPEAWQYTTGSRSVRVGIIDTGLDRSHPDLAANVWTNPGEVLGNGLDDDGNGLVDDTVGWDFYSDDADPSDAEGHGTHCAGTLGAVGNNATGVTGVCWQVGLVGIRFLGPGGGSTSDAIEAVHYATRLGCSLTSNSWGGGGSSTLLQDAIDAAGAAGIPFIAAAGNSGQNTDTSGSHYPSGYSSGNIIAVGAMDAAERVAGFSNFGPTSVDLFAPGVSIYSSFPGADYQTLSGTSMATPHVAGAVALLRSLVPSLSVAELKSQLLASTDALPAYAERCVSGGRLNLQRYLEPYSGPRPVITEATVAEAAGGNADGVLNPGEPLELSLALTNRGTLATGPLTVSLTSLSTASKVQITRGVLTLPSLSAGQSLVPSQRLELTTTLALTTPHTEQLRLTLSYGSPASEIIRTVPLVIHRTVRLAGRVTNAEDGSAVPTATIMAEGPRSLSARVAADGSFDLRVVDGSYSVSAVAPGFLRAVGTQHKVPPDALNLSIALLRPALRIQPSSLSLQLTAGDKSEQTVTLRNPGTAELEWSAELT
jgi:large repetitive protein